MTALFAIATALSAALLFVVQPMVSKALLPVLGGVPSVWNTCLVFFQSMVLLGYAYAHAVAMRLPARVQVVLHLALAVTAAAALVLPVRTEAGRFFSPTDEPIRWLVLQLTLAVGLPFAVLAATAPLLQRWFASGTRDRDPYVLYAGSNLGSLIGLLSYPVLLEPHLSLAAQRRLWMFGYVVFVALLAACGLASRGTPVVHAAPAATASRPLGAWRRVRWMLLALVPSSYLMGLTAFLTSEVAAVPFLWVVPLALYLISFILVFAPVTLVTHRRVARVMPALILFTVLVDVSGMTLPLAVLIPLHLAAFLVVAITCHGELACDRPPPAALTQYYLLMSLGGALGGALTALVAPLVFDRIVEYPLAMVLACLLRPAGDDSPRPGWLDVALPLALGGLTAGLVLAPWTHGLGEQARVAAMFGLPAILCYTFSTRPVRFALGLAALLLAAHLDLGPYGRPLLEERTFFGVLRVTVDPGGRFHQLVHGHTIHGRQHRSGSLRRVPLAYFHPTGPAGDIFTHARAQPTSAAVAVVGLGVGTLCAYARPGEEWVFYELDPAVERIARDERYFTFWRDCRAGRRSVVTGDARLRLVEAADGRYSVLVVDAFSSGVIPVHLITREALALYRRKTAPDGWIVFHLSSQHLDLLPLAARLAQDAGWVAYARDDLLLTAAERDAGKDPSRWVVMARTGEELQALAADRRWRALRAGDSAAVWTDDFSNIWSVIRAE